MRTALTIDDIDPLPADVGLSNRAYAELSGMYAKIAEAHEKRRPALRIVGELAQKCAAFDATINAAMPRIDPGETLEYVSGWKAPRPLTRQDAFMDALDAEGWIEWQGGNCPVPPETRIVIRMRGGHEREEPASHWVWDWATNPGVLSAFQIVAYRVIQSA